MYHADGPAETRPVEKLNSSRAGCSQRQQTPNTSHTTRRRKWRGRFGIVAGELASIAPATLPGLMCRLISRSGERPTPAAPAVGRGES
jgi:hypothetical protein